MKHYIIGYTGSDRMAVGEALAKELGCALMDTDSEIERLDGRSVMRICMLAGEHSYRNKEFELLAKLENPSYDHGLAKDEIYPDDLVVVCGDGIILDEQSFEILERNDTFFVDEPLETLWERANSDEAAAFSFSISGDDAEKRRIFEERFMMRLPLYRKASAK